MKYLLLSLLMFTGCATTKTPYAIEDVNVYDTVQVLRGELAGCSMKVRTVGTTSPNMHGGMSDVEFIVGEADCKDGRFTYDYEKLQAVEFESVRADRLIQREREPQGRLNR